MCWQERTESVPGETSTGLDPGISSLLAYLFSWVSGLIFWFIETTSTYVRYHAMHSMLYGCFVFVGIIIFGIIDAIIGGAALCSFDNGITIVTYRCWGNWLTMIWWLISFVGSIFLMVKAFMGKDTGVLVLFPLIGPFAYKQTYGGGSGGETGGEPA